MLYKPLTKEHEQPKHNEAPVCETLLISIADAMSAA